MALKNSLDTNFDQVLVEEKTCVRTLILNRPQKLNSLSYEMVSILLKNLREYEKNSSIKCVILKANGRAFSAGGDAVAIARYVTTGSLVKKTLLLDHYGQWSSAVGFYGGQLILDYIIATYDKPMVLLINGLVMGGGAGLCMNGRFRIVTEKTVFCMPETSLGHYPDVGASYFLSRLPGFFGEYLGLTGGRLNGAEMFACGLATHFVLSSNLPFLEIAISELSAPDYSSISEIINAFAVRPGLRKESAYNSLDVINKCFSRSTVEEILCALESEAANRDDKWLVTATRYTKAASPIGLKIFLRSIREGRMQTIDQCLVRECRMSFHVLRRTVSGDFFEGTRAILVEKDKKPKWEPSKLELVTEEMVQRYFTEVDHEVWKELKLPDRSCSAQIGRAKL